jgi:hypothetical protein
MLKLIVYILVAWLVTAALIGAVLGVAILWQTLTKHFGVAGEVTLVLFVIATFIGWVFWNDQRVKK